MLEERDKADDRSVALQGCQPRAAVLDATIGLGVQPDCERRARHQPQDGRHRQLADHAGYGLWLRREVTLGGETESGDCSVR